jgi:NADPH:quinone reductase and related Zn-dependent oxidoreductases
VNYLTAWQLLVVMGSLNPGETVLIHNAGGGVGLAAIDVARHIGATIYGTASSGKARLLEAARPARSHRLPQEGLDA